MRVGGFDVSEEDIEDWKEDDYGFYKKADTLRRTGQDASIEKRPKGWFPVFIDKLNHVYVTKDDKPRNKDDFCLYPLNEAGEKLSWSWGKRKIEDEPHNLIVVDGRNGKNIYKKQRPQLGDLPTAKPKSVFYKPEYSTSTATTCLKKLLDTRVFDGSKPIPFIRDLITIAGGKDGIILDFFAGSATAAHAVMQLNAEDGGNRRFIMVQLPEVCDDKSEAAKAGYKTIAEISKERIRRAGAKIKADNAGKEGIDQLDVGFRVLKVDSSNMAEVYYHPDALSQSLLENAKENIKPDRTAEDLLFQVMLDWGVDLALPIRQEQIDGKTVFFVDDNALAACFDDKGGVDEAFVKQLATRHPLRAVFRDAGFKSDSVKINIEQIFKLLSPTTDIKTI